MQKYKSEVLIVGGGLAGITCSLELLQENRKVLILDRDEERALGGLAKWAFGGMFFVDTPHQRKNKICDSTDLALKDWMSYAAFDEGEKWGRLWAELYIHLCTDHGYEWLRSKGLSFFRVLNWVERGLNADGNSVPRFHMVWGTGWELIRILKNELLSHINSGNLKIKFHHRALELITQNETVIGVRGKDEKEDDDFEAIAEHVVAATGGINGSIEKVRANWYKPWGDPPEFILNGAHPFAIGDLHTAIGNINGNVVNLDKQWNYAAGIPHYKPRHEGHGLSLVPCKSALWLDYEGKRIGPTPLVTGYDTRYMVERICAQGKKYSWQILNRKIALKEFAISGSEHNEAFRDKKFFKFVLAVLLGNKKLVNKIMEVSPDMIAADTLEELVDKMNNLHGTDDVHLSNVTQAVENYDQSMARGYPYEDIQQQLIYKARKWRGDKARTCNMQAISDPRAGPFIAIRTFILSRKSLGGVQTDLEARVLSKPHADGSQTEIPGLYAIGEAAGFGGGGIHGYRSLEGTFLGGCVITGRIAGRAILGKKL